MDSAQPTQRPRVLVVDDNRDAADSLALLLELWGYQPVVAYDGEAALEVVADLAPIAALIDLGLPGLDGFELARLLRGLPQMGSVVLMAVTGYGREEDRRRCQDAGYDHHLLKPFDPVELRDLLKRVSS
jgi:CheY-like chemotaxis protein